MLTEPEAERKAFEEQERMRQHVRDYAKAKARRDVIRNHNYEFLDGVTQERFGHLLEQCENDAHEIACEAGAEASAKAKRTALSLPAYEAGYIEAYADSLPALMATALAKRAAPTSAA
jgi:hypothetical protein